MGCFFTHGLYLNVYGNKIIKTYKWWWWWWWWWRWYVVWIERCFPSITWYTQSPSFTYLGLTLIVSDKYLCWYCCEETGLERFVSSCQRFYWLCIAFVYFQYVKKHTKDSKTSRELVPYQTAHNVTAFIDYAEKMVKAADPDATPRFGFLSFYHHF